MLLEIIDELYFLGFQGTEKQLTTEWGLTLQLNIVLLIERAVDMVADKSSNARPAIMSVCTRLFSIFNSNNKKHETVANQIRRWKFRNCLSANSLPVQLKRQLPPSQLVAKLKYSTSPLRQEHEEEQQLSSISRSPSSRFGLEMSTQFEKLQLAVEEKRTVDPNLLNRILLHASTVISDEQSSDDNKYEISTFLLDVLSVSRECRKLMRNSEYWSSVETVLDWLSCNDVLLIQNPSQSLQSMRSAGLYRFNIVLPERNNTKSKYANHPETPSENMFQQIIHDWKLLDQVCQSTTNFVPVFSHGRSSVRLNNWQLALRRAGEVVARASQDGPIGLAEIIDFHSGNLFVLERACALLQIDCTSGEVLLASGFCEVAGRSLRKSKPAHPFFLTALVRTTSMLIKAFEWKQIETVERIVVSECDDMLCDLLAWADANASVFLPVLKKRYQDSWSCAMRSSGTLNIWACIYEDKTLESKAVCILSPGEKVDVIETFDECWIRVKTLSNMKGWLQMCGLRGSCIVRSDVDL